MLLARARCLLLAPAALLLASLLGPTSALAQASTAPPPTTAPTAADQPPAGLAADEEARMRFELGRRYYDTGRFTDAVREFAEAHRLSGRAELLYNLFLAYRDAGDDVHAAETLRAYIPSLEPGERRTQLEARLRILEQRLAQGSSGADSTQTGGTGDGSGASGGSGDGGGDAAGSGASGSGASGSGASGAGSGGGGGLGVVPWVVVGVGGALVVASVITGVMALDARASLDRMCAADGSCPPGFESTQSSGQALAITTDILWVTGAVAVGTGVVLAIVDMGSGSSETAAITDAVTGGCTQQGCYVAARGSF